MEAKLQRIIWRRGEGVLLRAVTPGDGSVFRPGEAGVQQAQNEGEAGTWGVNKIQPFTELGGKGRAGRGQQPEDGAGSFLHVPLSVLFFPK